MMVYPLESTKMVSKLSEVSVKSQGMHRQGKLGTFKSNKLDFKLAISLMLAALKYCFML